LLAVAGILYESYGLSTGMPSGHAVLPATPSCCGDCSCAGPDVCYACGGCCWTSKCVDCVAGLGLEGFKLVHCGRVEDGSSFTVNAVLKSRDDRKLLVDLKLPSGFTHESMNPVLVGLKAGEPEVVAFKVHVTENVAEQEHVLRAVVLDSDWSTFSSAEATVSVYWSGRLTP